MSALAPPVRSEPRSSARLLVRAATLKRAVLWTFVFCGAAAAIEPSPYEFMFVVAALALGPSDLAFDRAMIPLIVGLAAFNAGGLLTLPPFVAERESVTFAAVSVYMALTAIFFAALVAKAPLERLRTIRSGYVAAGAFAATLGVLGYFNVAGLSEHFTLYEGTRASGPFKDPNVFGPFLAPPIVWLTQDLLLRRGAGFLRTFAPLALMAFGVLLSFSRGAWGVTIASVVLMAALTFATTQSATLRWRIAVVALVGAFVFALLLVVALSIPAVHDIFLMRASLSQDYDLGETGRFGSQLRSLPMLLERPFGFGPLQYRHFFPEDPHETYINAFASYGWLGGLSFLALTATTLYVGWRLVLTRSPYQSAAIAIWSCLFVQMAQGVQIDTDHWRHLFLLFGALYGLAAAERRSRASTEPQRRAIV
jgi:O-antigen ligase